MLDHPTSGRLEIGFAAGVPQELARIGLGMEEARERFNESLEHPRCRARHPRHQSPWQILDVRESNSRCRTCSCKRRCRNGRRSSVPRQPGSRRGERSKICTGFESVGRVTEIFDAYRNEAAQLGLPAGPDQLAIRRNASISRDAAAAHEASRAEKAATLKVVAGDPRVAARRVLPARCAKGRRRLSVHDDDYIAGTPAQVTEQIIEQCRNAVPAISWRCWGEASRLAAARPSRCSAKK